MIQFDEHIFQMGWNHQLDNICIVWSAKISKFMIPVMSVWGS